MSKKPSRRRKAPPTKRRRMTFKLTVEAQPMVVSSEPHWMRDVGHFEFRQPVQIGTRDSRERNRLQAFPPRWRTSGGAEPQAFARVHVLAMLDGERKRCADPSSLRFSDSRRARHREDGGKLQNAGVEGQKILCYSSLIALHH